MWGKYALCGLTLGLLSAGCTLVENGSRVAAWKVQESIDDCAERRRNRRWAEQAWEQVRQTDAAVRRSADYADGFKDGFADYLYRGGDGEPPPLPPHRYRTMHYQTPEGCQAIEDWFDGFRGGAEVARLGGYRDWVTGPSSLRSAEPAPPPIPVAPPPAPPPPAAVELPPPRPAAAKKETPRAPPPTPAVAPAAYWPDPAPPAPQAEKPPDATASPPAAPAHAWAKFRRESNTWVITWDGFVTKFTIMAK